MKAFTDDGDDGPSNLCVKVPSEILEKVTPWQPWKKPVIDDFDQFMIDKTGCEYVALSANQLDYSITRKYSGSLELNFAVRGFYMYIAVYWQNPYNHVYYYIHGPEGTSRMKSFIFDEGWSPKETQSTPDIVGENKYTAFYIKIDAGTMTFAKICDTEPSFRPFKRDIPINNNDEVKIQFIPLSKQGYGAALLIC